MSAPTLEALGDGALLLRFGDAIDVATNARVQAAFARLRVQAPPWLQDVVPAYASLALVFDPARVPGASATATVRAWLQARLAEAVTGDEPAPPVAGRRVEIPVCYGGEHGPDLDDVAAACGLSRDDVVARHAQRDYPVAMLGFSPGFPYLLGLDPALATPRLATPRPRVPAGSVGIGGAQTGIYPDAGPGGWRLIGRTPQRLFDPARTPPTVLRPGDRVRFVPIDGTRFAALVDAAP